jgi:hypothetical protein
VLNVTKAPDFGTYQASLNGVKLGDPLDFYDAKVVNEESHCWTFGRNLAPTPCAWNARARTTLPAVISAALSPSDCADPPPRVTAMAHDKTHDKDWRKDPKLYGCEAKWADPTVRPKRLHASRSATAALETPRFRS